MPFGSDYTGTRGMYEVISTAVDTIENDEGTYFWWSGSQRAFVGPSFYSGGSGGLMFIACILRRTTNEPNEPLDA